MIQPEELIEIGQIRKLHGKGGELACSLVVDIFEEVEPAFLILSVDNIFVPFPLEDYRYKGADTALLKFEGVSTEETARRLLGCKVYVEKRYLPDDYQTQFSSLSLVGFEVVDTVHGRIGVITAVDTTTLNPLFLLDNGQVIPAHDDFVQQIDDDRHRLLLTLPEGLLEL